MRKGEVDSSFGKRAMNAPADRGNLFTATREQAVACDFIGITPC